MVATSIETVAYHRAESWRLMSEVDVELGRGDVEAAAQALWDAAAHGITAAAARRGWARETHRELMDVIGRLIAEEGGPDDLSNNAIIAHSFNRRDRTWIMPIDAGGVRYCKDEPVTELLRVLEGMD